MSRVREYLAGSGKNSENSNHFDKSLAQYFRPPALGRNRRFARNHNNSMTEKITSNKVGGMATHETASINKSQVIPTQPMTQKIEKQKAKYATQSVLTPQIQIERHVSLGEKELDNDYEEVSVSGIGPAGILISQSNYNSLDEADLKQPNKQNQKKISS